MLRSRLKALKSGREKTRDNTEQRVEFVMPDPDLVVEYSPPDSEEHPENHFINSCATAWGAGKNIRRDEEHPRAFPQTVVVGR